MPLYDFVCDNNACASQGKRFSDLLRFEQAAVKRCADCGGLLRRPPVLTAKPLLATDSRFVDRAAAMGRPQASPSALARLVEEQGMDLHDERDIAYTREVAAGQDFLSEQAALRAQGVSPEELFQHRLTFNNSELKDVMRGPAPAELPAGASDAYDKIIAEEAPARAARPTEGVSHGHALDEFSVPALGQ